MKYGGYVYASHRKKTTKPWPNDSKKICIIWFLIYEFLRFFAFISFSHFCFNFFSLKLLLAGAANSLCLCVNVMLHNCNTWRHKVRTKDIIIHGTQFCFWRPSKEFLFCWFFVVVSLWVCSLPLSFYIFYFFSSAHSAQLKS